jgi:aromatase
MRRMSHEIEVDAPPGVVYGLVADTVRWPMFFPHHVHVERPEFDGTRERVRMWVVADGQVKSWTAVRVLDAERRRITFGQHMIMPPAQFMGGTWTVDDLGAGRSLLTMGHEFSAADDRPDDMAWLERATVAEARSDLESIRFFAERWGRLDSLVVSSTESVRVKGPAELVYAFLYEIADWQGQVPHVARVELEEAQAGVQKVVMDVRAPDGGVRTVESVRVCFPHAGRIVHKQFPVPGLVASSTGEWSVLPDETGVTVVAEHHVVLREEAVEQALGAGATVTDARRYVQAELSRESHEILELARRHAESAIRVL